MYDGFDNGGVVLDAVKCNGMKCYGLLLPAFGYGSVSAFGLMISLT